MDGLDGFEAPEQEIPTPPIDVADGTRERMVYVLTAMLQGATPEDVAVYLADGFPPAVAEALERPGEVDEMGAHVDLLLTVQQTPAAA